MFLNWILNILFALLSISSLFVTCEAFNDMQNLPKWLSALFFAGLWGIAYAIKIMKHSAVRKDCINKYIIIIIISCILLLIYGFFQITEAIIYSYFGQLQIHGNFDTISGFTGCLCAGIPLFFINMERKSKYIHKITKVFLIIAIVTILISKSRSGIICISLIIVYWIIFKYQISKRLQHITIGSLIFIFIGCYFLKKDSADGRLLIWRCCWEMIKDKPLLGHGIGSFEAHYMDYQAEYFRTHKQESRYAMLADNVKHAYNEFLLLGIQFGISGWFFLSILILLLCHCYKKKSSLKARAASLSLISIGIFSFFSYPFEYIFIWIIFLLDIVIIIHEAYPHIIAKSIFTRVFISMIILGASLFLIHKVYLRTSSEQEWNKITNCARQGEMQKVYQRYQKLMPSLGKNPKFLYNYAVELYMIGKYKSSMNIAKRCRKYSADYNLELLLAMNAIKIDRLKEAEGYLQSASLMCPNRFVPLFELAKLYERNNEITKATQMATIILNKKIKIDSPIIHSIRIEMRCLLGKYKD